MQHQKKVILLFLFPFLMWSQDKEIFATPEALKSEIVKTRYNNPDKAFELAEAFLKYGLDSNDHKIQVEAYHQLGKINGIKGSHIEAVQFYDKGIDIAKKINYLEYLIELLVVKGNAFYELNKDIEALDMYTKASKLVKAPNYRLYQWIIATNLALLKQRNGNFEEATKLFKNSLDLAYQYPNANKVLQANITSNITRNLGEAYLKRKLLDSSLYYNQLGLKISLVHNDIETSSNFLMLIGKVYFEKKEYDEAIKYLNKAAKKTETLGNSIIKNDISLLLGLSHFKINKIDASISLLEKCIQQYNADKENISIATYQEACIGLANLYNKNNDIKKSKIYYEKYIAVNDSLKEQETAFIKEYYKNDIAQLKSKINIYQSKILSQKQYTIIGIIFIILLSFFIYSYRKKLEQLFNKNKKTIESVPQNLIKKETPTINAKKVSAILKELRKLEKEEFFLHKNCSLYTIAKKLKTNTSYLSKIINNAENKTFNSYINDLRIQYAIHKINTDKTFRSYSVKSIAEEIGYKSTDSFVKYFKLKTGDLPSFYIKKHLSINT